MSPMNTSPQPRLDAVLRQASERIELTDARPLLAHVLGKPVSWLFAHGDETIEISALQRFRMLLEARESGRPVAYLIGRRGFWTLDLAVTADTLIPRPETELLVELAIARLPVSSPSRVADLGTGSGAIALAIAKERPECRVIATDASKGALDIAIDNAEGNGIRNVEFRMGSWFSPLMGERFDLIASNPPYIAEGDPHLDEGDLRFEPAAALSSGADGLDAIREIVADAPSHLTAGGWLLLEHGWEQGAAVRELLVLAGFEEVSSARDLEGRERVTLGRISLV